MDIVDQLRSFVATAQTGSFTSAATQLGISNRLTSKYVAELEQRLGTRLFQRTTRRVGLTPAGQDLLARAPALLDELDAMLADVTEETRGFSGMIRVSAPVTFGEVYVVGMLERFARDNPGLSIDLRLDDRFVDLARDGIDISFRLGQSDTLSLKTRKLGTFTTVLAASPSYLERYGTPRTLSDLQEHNCIVDTNRRAARHWHFETQDGTVTVPVDGRFQVNSARASVAIAEQGHGIVYAPYFSIRDSMSSGLLQRILPDLDGEAGPISAVYLEGRQLPRKIRALIDFALEDIRGSQVLS